MKRHQLHLLHVSAIREVATARKRIGYISVFVAASIRTPQQCGHVVISTGWDQCFDKLARKERLHSSASVAVSCTGENPDTRGAPVWIERGSKADDEEGLPFITGDRPNGSSRAGEAFTIDVTRVSLTEYILYLNCRGSK